MMESSVPPRRSVCAVIVSYFPDMDILERQILALERQVARIVVVDNGSPQATVDRLETIARGRDDVSVLSLGSNLGIAVAQNQGIRLAFEAADTHVLLLDQDSVPSAHMVVGLLDATDALRGRGIALAAVGPMTVDRKTGELGRFVRMRHGWVHQVRCVRGAPPMDVDFLIASGCLISVEALRRLGLMRESFFIDHVDTEWCMRALRAGMRLYGICNAEIEHSLGEERRRIWFMRSRLVHVHEPLRDYYSVRNGVSLIRSRLMSMPMLVAFLVRLLAYVVFFSVVVPPRRERLRMMVAGFRDALRNQGGMFAPRRCSRARAAR